MNSKKNYYYQKKELTLKKINIFIDWLIFYSKKNFMFNHYYILCHSKTLSN